MRLTDGDATFDYNLGFALPGISNGAGGVVPTNFQLAGAPGAPGTNWLPRANWFYRIAGDTRERHFTNVGGTTSLFGSNGVQYTFPTVFSGPSAAGTPVPDVTAWMDFSVTDTGVNRARLTTQVCFINTGQTQLDVDTFLAVDLDLDNTVFGDVYAPLSLSPNRIWTATDGIAAMRFSGPGAIGAAAGSFGLVMGNLTDAGIDNFPDMNAGGLTGAADNYALLQFRGTMAPHVMFCSSATIDIEIVPEPATLLLVSAALALAGRRRG